MTQQVLNVVLAAVIGVVGVIIAALIERVRRRTDEIHVLVNDRMTKALQQNERLEQRLDAALGLLNGHAKKEDP